MRIDAPSSSLAVMSGSFRGVFEGETTNSFLDKPLSSSLEAISSSTGKHLSDLSSSFSDTISNLSSSEETNLIVVSQSISGTIYELSSSATVQREAQYNALTSSIYVVSSSISQSIQNVSSSFNQSQLILSESFNSTTNYNSSSVSSSLSFLSSSFENSLVSASYEASQSLQDVSSSISGTVTNISTSLQNQINGRVKYTEFDNYQTVVDNTYYKSGSSPNLMSASIDNLIVSGKTLLVGDLYVSGTVTTVSEKDVSISDKFVVIASEASSSLEANNAGFGIGGTDVSMSYNASLDEIKLTKPLEAPAFRGYLSGSAYRAENLDSNGVLAAAIITLGNRTFLQETGSRQASATIYLYCARTRSFRTFNIEDNLGKVQLALPDTLIDGIEQTIILNNDTEQECTILPPEGCLAPTGFTSNRLDGRYAKPEEGYICRAGKALELTYISVNGSVIITQVVELN